MSTPSLRLDGRRALVTGAGRGLGFACASALAEAGAEVVAAARNAKEIGEAATSIRNAGGQCSPVALDVCDVAQVARWISREPAFDILVNNAGTNRPGPFLETRTEDYDAVFDVNVRASFFLTQAVARRLVEAGKRGSVIHMSSQMGHVGAARRAVYCASKHAVEGMTKAMAAELGPHQIRVNTICPTFIDTPLTRPYFEDDAFRAAVIAKIKLGRLGQPEDVMGAVVFLASDASALMTGSALMLDGGWTTS